MRIHQVCLFILLSVLSQLCCAEPASVPAPLPVRLGVTHVGLDRWRIDYVFAEPIEVLRLGSAVGDYRRQAWRILTPGASLTETDGQEAIRGTGGPLSAVSIEVTLDTAYREGLYTAFDRFSDGGTDLFLGYFDGEAAQGGQTRPLRIDLRLNGLAGETVVAPEAGVSALAGYAYFGPRTPVRAGAATLIIDPRAPDWLGPLLVETTAAISAMYERGLGRTLGHRPLLMVSIGDLDTPGLATKGGVVGRQVLYRFGGKALLGGSAAVRQRCMELIAHELAHIWQADLVRGGIGESEAWIHEGGAEALALAALRQSGLFSEADTDAFGARLLKECLALNGSVESYRGRYACGYKRFMDYDTDIFALWRGLMRSSETTGEVYSSAMIAVLRPGPAATSGRED